MKMCSFCYLCMLLETHFIFNFTHWNAFHSGPTNDGVHKLKAKLQQQKYHAGTLIIFTTLLYFNITVL